MHVTPLHYYPVRRRKKKVVHEKALIACGHWDMIWKEVSSAWMVLTMI